MTEDIFRKRPILGVADSSSDDIVLSPAWVHPSGHGEGWVGKYKKMDIHVFDTDMYWHNYTDWCEQVSVLKSADEHQSVSVKWATEKTNRDLPIVGWTRKKTAHKGVAYIVIHMDRADTNGAVTLHVDTLLSADDFDKAMVRSEEIYRHEPDLHKCQLYGEMLAQWLVTNYYSVTPSSYWHEDPECNWTGLYEPSLRLTVMDLEFPPKEAVNLNDGFWCYEEGIVSYDFFWRRSPENEVNINDMAGSQWLNGSSDAAGGRIPADPAQESGGSINVSTYISYKDNRSPVRVNLTKGEINSHCVEEVKCKSCMQTVIVSYLSVQKSSQSTKCPACKKPDVWFG
mgnify:CR=1 FL=1|tara:strand:+ start:15357 stop:16379 length:1023 start_codon:yes stop_codon:yes gene_type:complete